MRNCPVTVRASLQSVSVRIRVWWGGWRGQGDGSWGLHRVVHGQNQSSAPDHQFVFTQSELLIQTVIRWAAPSATSGGALAVDGAGTGCIRADGDVSVHRAHVSIVQDEVRVIIM